MVVSRFICCTSRTLSPIPWVVLLLPETIKSNRNDRKKINKQFERYYNVVDKPILAWDRVVGNMLEQAMPFLTLFWLNIGLAALGATRLNGVAAAGWIYVVFRALYPVSSPSVMAFRWPLST